LSVNLLAPAKKNKSTKNNDTEGIVDDGDGVNGGIVDDGDGVDGGIVDVEGIVDDGGSDDGDGVDGDVEGKPAIQLISNIIIFPLFVKA